MLCDPTDLIWKKGTPFEAMTDRTAPSSNIVLAGVFLSRKANKCQEICAHPPVSLPLATDVTEATLGASGHWLETRTGGGGTTTLA